MAKISGVEVDVVGKVGKFAGMLDMMIGDSYLFTREGLMQTKYFLVQDKQKSDKITRNLS